MGLTPSQVSQQRRIREGEGIFSPEQIISERLRASCDGTGETFSYENSIGDVQTFLVFDPHRQKVRRSPKGRWGITNYGGKMVRSACHVMQRQFGRHRLGFATLTLDNADKTALLLCCMFWAEIVRKTQQEIQRELDRVGAPIAIVGVTEIQVKRSNEAGFIIPHLHFVYVSWDGMSKVIKNINGKDKAVPDFYISHAKMKEIFDRVCANEISKHTDIPVDEIEINNRVNLQAVRKSAENYLGKYMSKGAKDIKKFLEADPKRDDIPSHWWHCTKDLRRVVKGLMQSVPVPIVEAILGNFKELIEDKIIQYCHPIEKEINGIKRTIGYGFRLCQEYISIGKDDIERAFNST